MRDFAQVTQMSMEVVVMLISQVLQGMVALATIDGRQMVAFFF